MKGGPEFAIKKLPGGIFIAELRSADEPICELHALVRKAERTDHPVAIEPVLVSLSAALEAGRPVDVIRSAKPFGNAARYPGNTVRFFDLVKKETPFEKGRAVRRIHDLISFA